MEKPLRRVLAENVEALMRAHPEVGTEKLLRRKARLGGGSVDGIRQMKTSPTLDTIEKLAKAFGLEPYQLLIPDLDPRNPARARTSADEKRFYRHLWQQVHHLQQEIAEYTAEREP